MAKLVANIIDGVLVVEIPVNETLVQSSSGKTLIVASSGRPQRTNADLEGKPVYISLCAYVYPK